MRQLKPVIQDAADRINDPMIDDNIQAIKAMVLIDKTTQQAVQAHLVQKESIVSSQNRSNTIVTGEDIRKVMNREIGD